MRYVACCRVMILIAAVCGACAFASCGGGDESGPGAEAETGRTDGEASKSDGAPAGEALTEQAAVEERINTGGEGITAGGFQDAGGQNVDSIFESFRPDAKRLGDFDVLKKDRIIRALVPYSLTHYFIDNGVQKGVSYELLKAFEEKINEDYKTGNLKIHVIIVPTSRDRMIPKLVNGYGDMALGNYTVTEERLKQVDFPDPIFSGVSEVVVTGPDSPEITSLEDLSGREVWVRRTSSYYVSLEKLNESFKEKGIGPVVIKPADENLEDEDILEMLNAGLIEFTVVDSHIAGLWSKVFEDVKVHEDITLRTGGEIAWMIRKDSPLLKNEINEFMEKSRKGTLFGNVLARKYFDNAKWIRDSLSEEDRARFNSMADIFKRYGGQYDFDWLMLAAQGYQESHLDQSKRSPAGAVGVMQLLPTTARDPNVGIPEIEKLENNIHAGTKYLRFMVNRYYDDPAIKSLDRMLFAFASYNAGPNKLNRLRNVAAERGLDPNVWFKNVEMVASEKIGRETTTYVSNIYKYYVAYQMVNESQAQKSSVKQVHGIK